MPDVDADRSMEDISAGNNLEEEAVSTRTSVVREDVEEISDEEAEWSDDVEAAGLSDFEVDIGDNLSWEEFDRRTITMFDSSQCVEGGRLATLACPTESPCALVRAGKLPPGDGQALSEAVMALAAAAVDDKWVEGVEAVTKVVQVALPACGEEERMVGQLVEVAMVGIDFTKAMEQPRPTHKVRHIKAGLKLVMELVRCGAPLRQVNDEQS